MIFAVVSGYEKNTFNLVVFKFNKDGKLVLLCLTLKFLNHENT